MKPSLFMSIMSVYYFCLLFLVFCLLFFVCCLHVLLADHFFESFDFSGRSERALGVLFSVGDGDFQYTLCLIGK